MYYAVRKKSIELHLAVERALLPKCFAFNRVNYTCVLTVQHIYLDTSESRNKKAWEYLKTNGFGASRSGEPFSDIEIL
jgi:hypothetical protein